MLWLPLSNDCLRLFNPTEKDDDHTVLCHHWNRWLLLSLQLLLVKRGLTPSRPLRPSFTLLKLYHNIVQFVWICFCLCAAFTERIIRKYIYVTQLFPPSFQFILKISQALNMQSTSLLVTLLFLFYIHSFVAVWSVCIMCMLSLPVHSQMTYRETYSHVRSIDRSLSPPGGAFQICIIENEYMLLFFNWRLS